MFFPQLNVTDGNFNGIFSVGNTFIFSQLFTFYGPRKTLPSLNHAKRKDGRVADSLLSLWLLYFQLPKNGRLEAFAGRFIYLGTNCTRWLLLLRLVKFRAIKLPFSFPFQVFLLLSFLYFSFVCS